MTGATLIETITVTRPMKVSYIVDNVINCNVIKNIVISNQYCSAELFILIEPFGFWNSELNKNKHNFNNAKTVPLNRGISQQIFLAHVLIYLHLRAHNYTKELKNADSRSFNPINKWCIRKIFGVSYLAAFILLSSEPELL